MYGASLTIAACIRSGTRADVAWIVDAQGLEIDDWSDATVFTPGGGRIGSLAGGALDAQLQDMAGISSVGRLVELEVSEIDALIAGVPSAGSASCLLIPVDRFPKELWDMVAARKQFCVATTLEGSEVVGLAVYGTDNIETAPELAGELFEAGIGGSKLSGNLVLSLFRAVPQIVLVGHTPVSSSLAELASRLGWKTRLVTDIPSATGLIASLSVLDKVVVTGHDLDLAGASLMAALEGDVGYIGSLGAHRMQENRADWLAYRGVTDLSRVHGPAGLDIGADSPGEIAVSILAEAIAAGSTDRSGV